MQEFELQSVIAAQCLAECVVLTNLSNASTSRAPILRKTAYEAINTTLVRPAREIAEETQRLEDLKRQRTARTVAVAVAEGETDSESEDEGADNTASGG